MFMEDWMSRQTAPRANRALLRANAKLVEVWVLNEPCPLILEVYAPRVLFGPPTFEAIAFKEATPLQVFRAAHSQLLCKQVCSAYPALRQAERIPQARERQAS